MTDYFFAQPSILSGIARLLDLGATFDSYNDDPRSDVADERAIFSDWLAVGNDLRRAYSEVTGQPADTLKSPLPRETLDGQT